MEEELRIIRYYWALAWRKPLYWLLPLLAVLIAGFVMIMMRPASYVSTAKVVLETHISNDLVQSTVSSDRMQFFEERVFSRANLVKLARDFELFESNVSLSEGQIAVLVRNRITLQVTQANPYEAILNSAVFTLGFEAETPARAAAVTSAIITMLQTENRSARLNQATEARRFLEQEVEALQAEADEQEEALASYIFKNEALLPNRLLLYTAETQDLQRELSTLQATMNTASADIRVLEAQYSASNSTQTQIAALQTELANKQTVLSPQHPDIVSLQARLETLIESAQSGTTAVSNSPEARLLNERINAARQQLAVNAERVEGVQARLTELRNQMAQMPGVEGEMSRLQRARDASALRLGAMRDRLETAFTSERLEAGQQDQQIRILETPEVPLYPSSRNRALFMTITIALALIAGIGALVVTDLLDRSIKGRDDLRAALEGAPLITLPYWEPEAPARRAYGRKPGPLRQQAAE